MAIDTPAPRDPVGNIDLARCRNGVIRVVGWMLWSETGNRLPVLRLRKRDSGTKGVELPVFPDARPDVNAYLGIDPSVATGFAGRQAINIYSMAELPFGLVDIVASDPNGEFEDKVIGKLEIEWPETPYQIPDTRDTDSPATKTAPAAKRRGFLDRLWNGAAGHDADMLEMMGDGAITATGLLRAFSKIGDGRPDLAGRAVDSVLGLAHRLKSASANDGLIVIFDHDYGGGANTFSRKLVAQHISTGNGVLRIWYNVAIGAFAARFTTPHEATEIAISTMDDLFRLLVELPSFAIQINSLWTYPQTHHFLDNLLRLRLYGHTGRMEFFAHDHLPVCPSLFLVDWTGKFCGVPDDLDTCRTCLKRNTQEFKSYYPDTDIERWRATWQSLLINCDLLRFFSESSRRNYVDAYPWMADTPNAVVKGHAVKDIWNRRYSRERALANKVEGEGLKIAVFGFISDHKGSEVLKSISDAIRAQGDNSRILVFGSLEGKVYGRHGAIDIMGPYAPVDMLDLCEDNGIDIAFTPSICPETFSFSTKELTLVGVPTASFGFGGQGDIVAGYDKGHILERGSGESLLGQFKAIAEAGFSRSPALT